VRAAEETRGLFYGRTRADGFCRGALGMFSISGSCSVSHPMRVIPTSWALVILSRGTHHRRFPAPARSPHSPEASEMHARVFVSLRFNNTSRTLAPVGPNHETRDAALASSRVRFLMGQLEQPLTSHRGPMFTLGSSLGRRARFLDDARARDEGFYFHDRDGPIYL
jgi:hypothetical protein